MRRNNTRNWLAWAGGSLIFIAITFTIIFFTHGQTTIIDKQPKKETTESLACSGENINYPIFTYDNSAKKATKINATFNNGELSSISFVHTLYYDDYEKIIASEAINHAAVNIDSQSTDIFNAYYSKFSDAMRMTMYTKSDALNNNNKKYLMLNSVSTSNLTKEAIKQNYEAQGFICAVGE